MKKFLNYLIISKMKTYILKEDQRTPPLFEGGIIRFVYGSTVYEKGIEPITSIFDVKVVCFKVTVHEYTIGGCLLFNAPS